MKTRERIIDAATRLFNEQGTSAVSTNHIAEAAGVSPGNLYYHFRNKEEIIRAIFEHLTILWDAVAVLPQDAPPSIRDMMRIIRGYFTVLQQYPFYYREITALMHHDPLLAEQYRAMRAGGLANVEQLLGYFGQIGVLSVPPDPQLLGKLAQICWILVDFWLPFSELAGGEPQPEQERRGEELVLAVLLPYVTSQALAELNGSDVPGSEGATRLSDDSDEGGEP